MIPALTVDELRARVTEKGPWFEVPANTTATRCRSCGVLIYFVKTAAGASMPVDVLVPGGVMPRRESPDDAWAPHAGRGVSHFATCPQSKQWGRR